MSKNSFCELYFFFLVLSKKELIKLNCDLEDTELKLVNCQVDRDEARKEWKKVLEEFWKKNKQVEELQEKLKLFDTK